MSKQDLASSYRLTMSDMQAELPAYQRLASRLVHAKPLSQLGSLLLHSLLRPLPTLTGALAALFTAAAVLLAIFTYRYQPSGLEVIYGFIIGWVGGVVADAVRWLLKH